MGNVFRSINVPTLVAVTVFIAVDRQFDLSGKLLRGVGLTPAR